MLEKIDVHTRDTGKKFVPSGITNIKRTATKKFRQICEMFFTVYKIRGNLFIPFIMFL